LAEISSNGAAVVRFAARITMRGMYPPPVQQPSPEKSREQFMREFAEKQAASRREIQRKLRLRREAKRRGENPPDLGPLYL
jgi:hypothetical protein